MARKQSQKKKGGTSKYGRNRAECERYRQRVGKPRGPGVPGNKAGKNKTLR
jgi:hypothetical protein